MTTLSHGEAIRQEHIIRRLIRREIGEPFTDDQRAQIERDALSFLCLSIADDAYYRPVPVIDVMAAIEFAAGNPR